MSKFIKEEKSLSKQVAKIGEEKQQLLNKLYDLGLAPFYGYYEAKLKDSQEERK